MTPVLTSIDAPTLVCVTDHLSPGERIKNRRTALGLSVRALATRSRVERGTIDKAERDEAGVRDTTFARLEAALAQIEEETGQNGPDLVTSTIKLADGSEVIFAGPADGVAEAAARYMAERGM